MFQGLGNCDLMIMKSQKRSVMSRLKSCLCVFLYSSTFAVKVLNN